MPILAQDYLSCFPFRHSDPGPHPVAWVEGPGKAFAEGEQRQVPWGHPCCWEARQPQGQGGRMDTWHTRRRSRSPQTPARPRSEYPSQRSQHRLLSQSSTSGPRSCDRWEVPPPQTPAAGMDANLLAIVSSRKPAFKVFLDDQGIQTCSDLKYSWPSGKDLLSVRTGPSSSPWQCRKHTWPPAMNERESVIPGRPKPLRCGTNLIEQAHLTHARLNKPAEKWRRTSNSRWSISSTSKNLGCPGSAYMIRPACRPWENLWRDWVLSLQPLAGEVGQIRGGAGLSCEDPHAIAAFRVFCGRWL